MHAHKKHSSKLKSSQTTNPMNSAGFVTELGLQLSWVRRRIKSEIGENHGNS